MALFNLARMTVASSGTGTITLNAAVTGFLTFDLAGCSTAASGQNITYGISDTANSEIGRGVYTSSSLTLTRGSSTFGLVTTNSNSPINMSNAAHVFIAASARDMPNNCRITVYTSTAAAVYTAPTYLSYVIVEAVGGGGGGGGVINPSSLGTYFSAGGGGGGYSRTSIMSSRITSTGLAITVGSGGAGGSGAGTGTSGGTTSVGALCIANGGSGATGSSGSAISGGSSDGISEAGAGGAAGTGDVTSPGWRGGATALFPDSDVYISLSGTGGDSIYGSGGARSALARGAVSAGGNGSGYGSGGGGGATRASTNTVSGGNGASGIVIITEFFG